MIIALQTLVFFRESIIALLHRILRPYYKNLSLSLSRHGNASDDEDVEEQVFAEFHDEKGVVFFPPMYVQRYAAVSDCLMDERWCGHLQKVVDLGYHDLSFIKYLKELPGVETILGVDLDTVPLSCSNNLLNLDDNSKTLKTRDNPVNITLYQGNAADPDYRLIGCDAVVGIEMIEHMLPHDLDRMIHTVFGFIKPWIAVFSTPNSDFNVLFKALESNGLRRLDHYFEWTREQFHDWCSNIVERYPDYTVSCRGIGPGPQGTNQYGCCSQLALFVSKDYHKQQDLNLNSLALVSNAPDPDDLTHTIVNPNNTLSNIPSNASTNSTGANSITELLYADCAQSSITIVLTTPTYSLESLVYCDKMAQCNMDMEIGKNFLMFNYEEMNYPVLVPRRTVSNKIYEIEDVNSRLNCSTLQVKTFSKTTTKLLHKNKLDSLSYTRDVIDEIKQLSKMLNLNKDKVNDCEPRLWNNINWGDNAPYWNQYFKVVKEYRHPYENIYTEDNHILDVITEEINKRIDVRCHEDVSVEVQRLEIPIEPLMNAVEHITCDVDKVKDLLEWNGYELQDDCVIFTRSLADDLSTVTQELDLQDSFSDLDDAFSTSFSYGSTYAHDYGRTLQRAIEVKVRRLHTMVSIDKDVTCEVDHVLSRLTKMALRSHRGRGGLPPQRWLHCRLYDLLALTEKAIERRRNHIANNIEQSNGNQDAVLSNLPFALIKYKQDRTGRRLLKKYKDLVNIQESLGALDPRPEFGLSDTVVTDELSDASKDVLKDPFSVNACPSSQIVDFDDNDFDPNANTMQGPCNENTYENDKNISNYFGFISSGDTDNSVLNNRLRIRKPAKRTKSRSPQKKDSTTVLWKESASKKSIENKRKNKRKDKTLKDKSTNMRTIKKPGRQKSNCLLKNCHDAIIPDYVNCRYLRTKQEIRESFSLYPTASKPIPGSLINFCHPELNGCKNVDDYKWTLKTENTEANHIAENNESLFNNAEESQLANILMDDLEEKTVLDSEIFRTETINGEIQCKDETSKLNFFETNKRDIELSENINQILDPQAVYVYDVNEPTTSKGVRHTNTDAQCGPDVATMPYASVSETTSLSKLPRIFNTGIKIDDSMLNAFRDMKDFGMSTYDYSYEEAFNMANLDLRRDMGIDAEVFAKNKKSEQSTHTDTYSNILTPRTPTMYKGIIIKDIENSINEENSTKDTGISTNENNLLSAKINTESKFSQIDIQDRQVSSTMTDDFLMYVDQQVNLEQIETKTLKAVSSKMRNEDSVSEFCESTSTSQYPDSSNVKSECQIVTPTSKAGAIRKTSIAKKNRLSYVGAHVHSYKDRQVSEDVFYQGIWQEQRSRLPPPTKSLNSIKPKISGGSMRKSTVKCTEKVALRKAPFRPKSGKSNQDIGKKTKQKPKMTYKPIVRVKKDVVKVCSRSSIKSVGSKTSKQSYITKKKQITFNHAVKNSYQYLRKFTEQTPKKSTIKDKFNEVQKTEDKKPTKNFLEINKEKSKISPPSEAARKAETPRRKPIPNSLSYKSDDSVRTSEYRSRTKSEVRSVCNDLDKKGNNDNFKPRSLSTPMRRKNIYDKRNNLTLFRESLATNVNFTVCCNMFNDKSSLENDPQSSNQNETNENIFDQYNINPPSQTSSNCSSPNSIGTVKSVVTSRKTMINRPLSSISNKIKVEKSNPEVQSAKRPKTACKVDDKENLECEKINPKGMFTKKSKNVFIAQLAPDNITMTKKGEKPVPSTTSENNCEDKPPTDNETSNDEQFRPQECSSAINEVLLIDARNFPEPPICYSDIENLSSDTHSYGNDLIELSEGESIRNWFENSSKLKKCDSDVVEDMKQLIEDKLTFITNALNDTTVLEPSSLFVSLENEDIDIRSSVYSIKTVVDGDDNENDNTLDALKQVSSDAQSIPTETDRTSFRSTSSLSKSSDIFYTDNEFNTNENQEIIDVSSVTGIFERKDPLMIQTTAGPISIQVFSGLSMNAVPSVAGDTPDFVNFVDSETGSFTTGVRRQATSEEIFVSGGSSGSYETCAVEEEAVVPEWLFEMLSQHDAVEPLDIEPIPEDMEAFEQPLDLNGNALEGAPHAGAGDGRGMHSDHSPDSSGHGSSYSSSDTSSGPRSEAVLVDPSAFNHYTTIPETTSDATILTMATAAEDSVRSLPVSGTATTTHHDEAWRPASDTRLAASDGDADVSSIDTDGQDYSDN